MDTCVHDCIRQSFILAPEPQDQQLCPLITERPHELDREEVQFV